MFQSRARDLELGTFEPSGLNPRAQTLGLEPSGSNSRARGGVMVRGGRSRLLSRVLSCAVRILMSYDRRMYVRLYVAHRDSAALRHEHSVIGESGIDTAEIPDIC